MSSTVAVAAAVGEVGLEVEFAKCGCCGLTEECTPAYIARVSDRFRGRWVCGLCAAAVDDEICRSDGAIGMDEALARHVSFCGGFRAAIPPADPTGHLIAAMRQILRRGLVARALRSTPSSPRRAEPAALARSGSCLTTFAG